MKQLVLRLDDDTAALYKSRLALDRCSMKQHLERYIKAYLDGLLAVDSFAESNTRCRCGVLCSSAREARQMSDSTPCGHMLKPVPASEALMLELFAERGINITEGA